MTLVRNDLREIGPFPKGVDNVSRDTPVNALRAAENVDLSDEGKARRRAGYRKVRAGTRVQSIFADPRLPYMAARVGDDLLLLEGDQLELAQSIATGLGTAPAAYAVLNNELLWTVEGVATGRVDMMGEPTSLGAPRGVLPALQAGAGGGLDGGRYLVAVSYILDSGEQGGASDPQAVTVADNGAIRVVLPDPPDAVTEMRIWRTEADGTLLQHAMDVPAGVAEAILMKGALGVDCETLDLQPLPAGHEIAVLNGIAWVAVGSHVYHGRALRPFQHHPGHDRIPYRDRIDLMLPVGEGENAGMFIASGKRTFFVAGPRTATLNQRIAYGHGAVPGTGLLAPAEMFGRSGGLVAYWMGRNGVPCLGLPGGQVVPLTQNTTAMDRFERGASLLRESAGFNTVVTAGFGGTASSTGVGDSVEVFQYRNGIPVP